jgi:hypothetical protein
MTTTPFLSFYQNLPVWQYLKTQLVESKTVLASSTQLRIQFPTQVFLQDKNILSIEAYSIHDMSITPGGNVLPTAANMLQSVLTLYSNDPENPTASGEYVTQFPLLSLHRMVNGTDPYVFELPKLIPRVITWEKSYIDFLPTAANATLGNSASLAYLFNVVYTGLDSTS